MIESTYIHGLEWTAKELFVYPNELIYWTIQIVMYPFMTGLVAGAFVLSSLYHVFGQKDLEGMARFSLVFSLALLIIAPLPLLGHLQSPLRALNPMLTPHLTSAIAAFGMVFSAYGLLVAIEIWFVYRKFIVEQAIAFKKKTGLKDRGMYLIYHLLTLGAYDLSEKAIDTDKKAVTILAAIGIPVALFLHGYAGFIFGSVKANALWMSPLMPVIFIMSAVVSGIALSMVTYIAVMEWKKFQTILARGRGDDSVTLIKGVQLDVITKASRYLIFFLVGAISLEFLDLVFRSYTATKSWDILRSVMYGKDFVSIFILQYLFGNFIPLVLLLLPKLTVRRSVIALVLILYGVFMMRWNVVIGGQSFSLSFEGYMHYNLPIIPTNLETFKEGVVGAAIIMALPFVVFYVINKILPALQTEEA